MCCEKRNLMNEVPTDHLWDLLLVETTSPFAKILITELRSREIREKNKKLREDINDAIVDCCCCGVKRKW